MHSLRAIWVKKHKDVMQCASKHLRVHSQSNVCFVFNQHACLP